MGFARVVGDSGGGVFSSKFGSLLSTFEGHNGTIPHSTKEFLIDLCTNVFNLAA